MQRERPDFEDLTHRLLLEVMIVDDHPRPGRKDATRAREAAILRELREAGFEQMTPNASLLAAVDSGLPTEQDHNYRAYVDHFATVVVKHSHKISAYRAQRPGFDLGFLVFDESTAYFESLAARIPEQSAGNPTRVSQPQVFESRVPHPLSPQHSRLGRGPDGLRSERLRKIRCAGPLRLDPARLVGECR